MEWQELIVDAYGRVLEILERALDGLTQDDLNKQLQPDSNSIGWLVWHLTRVQDRRNVSYTGKEELWVSDGWHTKFNYPADPQDIGLGHNAEDLAAFKSSDVKTLLGYHRAVLERTKSYIRSLSMDELDRMITLPPPRPPQKVGTLLIRALSDNMQHAGQVAYLRGLFKGQGWYGA